MLLVLLIISAAIQAYPASNGSALFQKITSIYDGDTFIASIAGWHAIIGERISIRVNGVDTPEMRGKCDKEKALAREAKQHAGAMLRADKLIQLENM